MAVGRIGSLPIATLPPSMAFVKPGSPADRTIARITPVPVAGNADSRYRSNRLTWTLGVFQPAFRYFGVQTLLATQAKPALRLRINAENL
jgi:hypothetical protein